MKLALLLTLAAAVLAAGQADPPPATPPADAAVVAAGKAVFETQCSLCHSVTPGEAGQGPELNGVIGRPIGGADFPYSDALKARRAEPWTPATVDAFLADPQVFAPGTAMPVRMDDAAQRHALVAYLASTR